MKFVYDDDDDDDAPGRAIARLSIIFRIVFTHYHHYHCSETYKQ